MSEKAASKTSVDDVALLPCPFCGSTELNGPHISEYVGDHYSTSWWVDCENCPGGMEVDGEEVTGLVDAWNKRADYADAEKYRSFMKGFGVAHRASLGKDCGVWDSRNIGQ